MPTSFDAVGVGEVDVWREKLLEKADRRMEERKGGNEGTCQRFRSTKERHTWGGLKRKRFTAAEENICNAL